MMRAALRVEWCKLWRLRLYRVTVALGAGLSLLWIVVALYFVGRGTPALREDFLHRLTWPGAFLQAFSLAAGFGETFVAIVTAAFVANEYAWGTWRLLLPTGLPRWQALLAKLLGLWAGAGLFVLVTASVPIVAAPVVSLVLGEPLFARAALPEHFWLTYALAPLRAVVGLLAPIVLAFVLAVMTRSQAVASGVVIGLVLGEGIVVALLEGLGGRWASLPRFFYLWNAEALAARAPVFGAPPPGVPALGEAFFTVVGWTLVLVLASLWWFQRRDIEVRAAT